MVSAKDGLFFSDSFIRGERRGSMGSSRQREEVIQGNAWRSMTSRFTACGLCLSKPSVVCVSKLQYSCDHMHLKLRQRQSILNFWPIADHPGLASAFCIKMLWKSMSEVTCELEIYIEQRVVNILYYTKNVRKHYIKH